MSAARRRACVENVTGKLDVSERFACRVLGQQRSVQRRTLRVADDEEALKESTIDLARHYAWTYDLVEDRTRDGRTPRMLNVVDE